MKFRRIACLLLAATMLLAGFALAENEAEDLAAKVEELEARLEAAQELLDLYYPYYERQVVAEYDGGAVMLDDVMPEYQYYENMYAQSGMTLSGSGYETELKKDIVEGVTESAVMLQRARQEGIALTEEELARVDEEAENAVQYYIANYGPYLAAEDASDEEVRQAVLDFLADNGYDQDAIYAESYDRVMLDAIYNWMVRDVEVTDDDVREAYEAKLAADEEAYTSSSYRFEGAMNRRETISWNPEGYRAVKQVLIGFDDDQSARYSDITGRVSALTAELAAAQGEDAPEDARDAADIQADIDAANAELDALYEELMPTVNEVIARFNDGEDFDALMDEYSADTGLLQEPTRSTGYYVHKDYAPWIELGIPRVSVWDDAFRLAAGSIENIGEISEPARGMYGIYIVYYMADVPAGAVPFEDLYDILKENAYSERAQEVYDATLSQWLADANVVYHLDRFQ